MLCSKVASEMKPTLFEQIEAKNIKCEICGGDTLPLYGGGWDNDRIYCPSVNCGAEYIFPTSTIQKGGDDEADT